MKRSLAVYAVRGLLRMRGWRPPWINLPPGAVIVAPNHQSLLDGPLIACLTDRPMLFGVDPDWCCRQPWRLVLMLLKWLGVGETVPLDARKPFAWRRLAARLNEGYAVCLFPEGAIARGEELLPIRPGLARLARLVSAPVLPVRISGTAALSSRRPGAALTSPSVTVGALVSASDTDLERIVTEALRGRELPAAQHSPVHQLELNPPSTGRP